MKLGRRTFFQIVGVGGTAALAAAPALASGTPAAQAAATGDEAGVLVDTTLCVGCRACEAACAEANQLPDPPASDAVFESRRETAPQTFTVVNRAKGPIGVEERYAKKQCMHCVAPACASACPVKAIQKLPTGPVVYDPGKCMGCRYCMVSCPFEIPKYEYEALAPRVRKCSFCAERQAVGLAPACTSVCPSGALTFGKRIDLLELAKTRIYQNPGKYVHHVYGEHEAGGTSWMYLSDVPFERLALPEDVLTEPYPELVKGALGAPPFVMTLWPPLLMGLYTFSRRREAVAHEEHGHGEEKGGRHG